MDNQIVKQFTISDILSVATNIFKQHWKLIIIFAAIFYIPTFISFGFYTQYIQFDKIMEGNMIVYMQTFNPTDLFLGVPPLYWVALIIISLIQFLPIIGISNIVNDCASNESPNLAKIIAITFQRALPFIFTYFLAIILISVASLFFIIPGIILMVYFSFWFSIVSIRNKSFLGALIHSYQVVKGRFWIVLGYSLLLVLMVIGINLIFSIFSLISSNAIFQSVISIFSTLAATIVYVAQAVFFINFENTKMVQE